MFWIFKCCSRTTTQENHQGLQQATVTTSGEARSRAAIQRAVDSHDYLHATQLLMDYHDHFEISTDDRQNWSAFLNVSTFTSPYQIITEAATVLNLQFLPDSKKNAYPAYAYLIEHQESLTVIGINVLYIENDDLELLLQAIAKQNHVTTFELHGIMALTLDMLISLTTLLTAHEASLTCFSIHGKQMDDACAEALSKALAHNHTLEVLELNDLSMTSSQITLILKALIDKPSLGALLEVNLEGSTVDGESLAIIEQLQSKHPQLDIIKPKTGNKLS